MKKKLISLFMVATLSISTLTACGKGGVSTEDFDNIVSENENYKNQIAELTNRLNAYEGDDASSPAISVTGDGTGRFSFNSKDSQIIFPSSFQYPDSTSIQPDGTISVNDSIRIKPSSNWITRVSGSSIDLENTAGGISGTVKVSAANNLIENQELKNNVLAPWFEKLSNPSDVKYSDIFIESEAYGSQAEVPILIDSEKAYLICGMLGYTGYSIVYIFVYRGDKDTNKSESIKSMLNTIAIDGSSIVVQN